MKATIRLHYVRWTQPEPFWTVDFPGTTGFTNLDQDFDSEAKAVEAAKKAGAKHIELRQGGRPR
jgi:hypothetical protein